MNRLTVLARSILLAGVTGISIPASAALLQYEFSGWLTVQNAAAQTLHAQAGMTGTSSRVPFVARWVLDTDATPLVVTNIPTLQRNLYTGAVTSIEAVIGGYAFSSTRPLFDDPGQVFNGPYDEQLTDVQNGTGAGGIDRLVIETKDRSGLVNSPGPKTPLFNSFTRPIDLTVNGNTFTTLSFRAIDTRLDLGGLDLFGAPSLPTGINAMGLNPLLSGVRLGLTAVYSGPGAAPASANATFYTQDFSLTVSPVPEAGSAWMLLAGLSMLALRRLRKPAKD